MAIRGKEKTTRHMHNLTKQKHYIYPIITWQPCNISRTLHV